MTIQQCRYVLKIIECGSFNEAAKQLFVAQSSLSVSVKGLETELGIKIFERAGGGIHLTESGAEFARYARRICEQSDFILKHYKNNETGGRLFVTTQHYDFVADVFAKFINDADEERYNFSLREMKTHDVIKETENAYCDIGVIAVKGLDSTIMERYITKRGLVFVPLHKALPHVYLRKGHPLDGHDLIKKDELEGYPYVSYEQGKHNSSFFAEEIYDPMGGKHIEISDRASLMNFLLATDAYTVGTGVMPSVLSMGRIISVPFESDDYYTIGYILRADKKISKLTQDFIFLLKQTLAKER